MNLHGVRINIGISIGFAMAPADGTDAALLLQRADVAMYAAKTGSGTGVNFYQPETDTNTPRRLALANDLHTAIANGELKVVYQPKISFLDGQITGFESLVRWNHPYFGYIPPDEFIPLAERTGMIQPITEFVMRTALNQLNEWNHQGHHWGIAVNLSMRNLIDNTLTAFVADLLTDTRLQPHQVTFEITETSMMSDPTRTIASLQALADLGVRLSIDDFGTGYSSLSHLQKLPVHELKIDKSFVLPLAANHNAEPIVRSILDLARHMKLTVVAEGIEDRATWNLLQQLGCEEGQG